MKNACVVTLEVSIRCLLRSRKKSKGAEAGRDYDLIVEDSYPNNLTSIVCPPGHAVRSSVASVAAACFFRLFVSFDNASEFFAAQA